MDSLKRAKNPPLKSISLNSPAKLNLYLKVFNKRKDGFHNIETVLEKINLCDQLILKNNKAGRIKILSNHSACPCDKTNLCYKAAEILKKTQKVPFGVDITIRKNIPVGSGLGGGSSNAAFTLLGLNRLWGLNLSRAKLLSYAKRLGSDVAFFVYPESFALGSGRGELIRPLKGIRPLWHILIVPNIRLSTAEAYKRIEILRRQASRRKSSFRGVKPATKSLHTKMLTKTSSNVNILIHALRRNKLSLLSKRLFNDFGESLFRTYPGLFKIQNRLKGLGVKGFSFSGKGPSVFGLPESRKEALNLRRKLAKQYRVYVVRTFSEMQEDHLWR